MISLLGLEPATYRAHWLHGPDRSFPETNCYTDLWIELLHGQGLDPLAMLASSLIVDFEGDQWTFHKPPPGDLERLYGAEIQELIVYRRLEDHVVEQLRLGRTVIVEVDGWFLPDTTGRSYRASHEKTSIAVEAIDPASATLRYFHGNGYFELAGDDYRGAIRVGETDEAILSPYVEHVRNDRLPACPADRLRGLAGELLRERLELVPATNPVARFGERLVADLPSIRSETVYHRYTFATLRQCGSAWACAEAFLRWLGDAYDEAAASFDALAGLSKTLSFKLARAAMLDRPLDPGPHLAEMAATWERAFAALPTRPVAA